MKNRFGISKTPYKAMFDFDSKVGLTISTRPYVIIDVEDTLENFTVILIGRENSINQKATSIFLFLLLPPNKEIV